jgi:hypothetical protein
MSRRAQSCVRKPVGGGVIGGFSPIISSVTAVDAFKKLPAIRLFLNFSQVCNFEQLSLSKRLTISGEQQIERL